VLGWPHVFGSVVLSTTKVNVALGLKWNGVVAHAAPGAGRQMSDTCETPGSEPVRLRSSIDAAMPVIGTVGRFDAHTLVERGPPGPIGLTGGVASVGVPDGLEQVVVEKPAILAGSFAASRPTATGFVGNVSGAP
jgi:hypothetical protein